MRFRLTTLAPGFSDDKPEAGAGLLPDRGRKLERLLNEVVNGVCQ